jgi:hypothetical protein
MKPIAVPSTDIQKEKKKNSSPASATTPTTILNGLIDSCATKHYCGMLSDNILILITIILHM